MRPGLLIVRPDVILQRMHYLHQTWWQYVRYYSGKYFVVTMKQLYWSTVSYTLGRYKLWNANNDPNLLSEASFLDYRITCLT
jgi:hypothetical protein